MHIQMNRNRSRVKVYQRYLFFFQAGITTFNLDDSQSIHSKQLHRSATANSRGFCQYTITGVFHVHMLQEKSQTQWNIIYNFKKATSSLFHCVTHGKCV